MYSFILTFLPMTAVLVFTAYMFIKRSKYPDRKGGGAFLFSLEYWPALSGAVGGY